MEWEGKQWDPWLLIMQLIYIHNKMRRERKRKWERQCWKVRRRRRWTGGERQSFQPRGERQSDSFSFFFYVFFLKILLFFFYKDCDFFLYMQIDCTTLGALRPYLYTIILGGFTCRQNLILIIWIKFTL